MLQMVAGGSRRGGAAALAGGRAHGASVADRAGATGAAGRAQEDPPGAARRRRRYRLSVCVCGIGALKTRLMARRVAIRVAGCLLLLVSTSSLCAAPHAYVAPDVRPGEYAAYERHADYVAVADGTRLAVSWYVPSQGARRRTLSGPAVVHAGPSRKHRSAQRRDSSRHGSRGTRVFYRTWICRGDRGNARQRRILRFSGHRSRSTDWQGWPGSRELDRPADAGPPARSA